MKPEQVAKLLREKRRRIAESSPELVRRVGVTTLNVARRLTPPNDYGKKGNGNNGLKGLRDRIAKELISEDGKTLPTAIPNKAGRPVRVQGQLGYAGFGFIVARQAGRRKFKTHSPAALIKQRRFRRHGNVVRARAAKGGGLYFVRSSELRSLVRALQKQAGALISAWAPAAQALRASNLAAFSPCKGKHRQGKGRFDVQEGLVEFYASADWGDLVVYKHFVSQFGSIIPRVARRSVEETKKWFFKNIGL